MDAGTDAGEMAADCMNGVRDGDESSIDCGGPTCPPCGGSNCRSIDDCESRVCDRGRCLMPTCMDGVRNGDETGVDCGLCPGWCACTSNDQCPLGRCHRCLCREAWSCEDGRTNADETDIDCGGPVCPFCEGGASCDTDTDCASVICAAGVCTDPTCFDSVQNQDETDVDCGGARCPPCTVGQGCRVHADCESGACSSETCE